MVRSLIFIIITTFGLNSCVMQSASQEVNSFDLNQKLQREIDKEGIPMLGAAIVKSGKVVWESYHVNSRIAELPTPNRQSIFSLGSISKLLTATAALQLYEKGQLDLDQDLSDYLKVNFRNPNFPDEVITARHLLTHSAGLAKSIRGAADFTITYTDNRKLELKPIVTKYLVKSGSEFSPELWTRAKPGESIISSNVGVAVLGYLVEVISGVNFYEYCRINIFEPLQMNDTYFVASENRDKFNMHVPLYLPSSLNTFDQYDNILSPAFGAHSSINDLSRFITSIVQTSDNQDSKILDSITIREMLDMNSTITNLPFNSAIGLMWRAPFNAEWIGHTGGVPGASTSMDFNKKNGVSVIILVNQQRQFSIYPRGKIYKFLHEYASENY